MYLLLTSPSRWAWVARSTAAEWQRSTARRPGSNSPFLYPPSLVVRGRAGGRRREYPPAFLAAGLPLAVGLPERVPLVWRGEKEEGDVGAVRRDGFAFVLVVRFF